MLYAGIDVGQSGTTAAVGDDDRTLALGHAGPGDEVGQHSGSTRLRDAMRDALADATRRAGLDATTTFDAIVAGISGYEGRLVGTPPQLPSRNVTLMHDAPVAHAAAFGSEPGVLVIAGTGSVAYSRARDGRTQTTGGWGYLFGDEGSAFWIARRIVTAAIHGDERRAQALLHYFSAASLREFVRLVYNDELTRDRFASYAGVVLETDEESADACAAQLGVLAQSAILEQPCAIAFTGGLMRIASFKTRVYEKMRELEPACTLVEPVAEPAEGALILARRA